MLVCFVFDQLIFSSNEDLLRVFKPFAEINVKENADYILDFEELRSWMETTSKDSIYTVFDNIIK